MRKVNSIIAIVYSVILALVEVFLNWGDWQYAPLWIVDYMIVIILLLGVFVFKKNQRKVLLMGWSFSSGVMYMVLFINLEPTSTITKLDSYILYAVVLALMVSLTGIFLSMREKNV